MSADTDKLIAQARKWNGGPLVSTHPAVRDLLPALADALEAAEAQRDALQKATAQYADWVGLCRAKLEAAEAQRDTLTAGVAEIERMRDEAIKCYGDCLEEGSYAEAGLWDIRASSYSRALGLLDRAALAAVTPPEEPQP